MRCLNLVGTSYSLTQSNVITPLPFTTYQGFTGDGANDLNTGFNPVTAAGNFALNNASIGAWVFNSRTSGAALAAMGNNGPGGTGSAILWPLGGAGVLQGTINDLAYTSSTGTVSNAQGWSVVDRAISSSFAFYKNGALFETEAVPSAGMFSGPIYLFGINNNNANVLQATTDKLSAAFIGASLGSAGQLALYTRLRTYMTAIGVP